MTPAEIAKHSAVGLTLEPVWRVVIELGPQDRNLYREIRQRLELRYGNYRAVAFESATGTQYFLPEAGSVMGQASGEGDTVQERPVSCLSFSIPRDEVQLGILLKTVANLHSYEEPVLYVMEGYASRTDGSVPLTSKAKWWNREGP